MRQVHVPLADETDRDMAVRGCVPARARGPDRHRTTTTSGGSVTATTVVSREALDALKNTADQLARAEEALADAKRKEQEARSNATRALNARNEALRAFERARRALLTRDAADELSRTPPSMFER